MKPKDNKKYIGIEIEFYAAILDYQCEEILQNHLTCEFDLGSDGTIYPDYPDGKIKHHKDCNFYLCDPNDGFSLCKWQKLPERDFELRLLIPQDQVKKHMVELEKAFKLIKPKVNDSCGLHVHLDMRNRDRYQCFKNLVACQDILYKMNPKNRIASGYCNRIDYPEWDYGSHYKGINMQDAYEEHKTIEVRIHQGCVKPMKILSYVNLLVKIVEYGHIISKPIDSAKDLIKRVKPRLESQKYIKECIRKYA